MRSKGVPPTTLSVTPTLGITDACTCLSLDSSAVKAGGPLAEGRSRANPVSQVPSGLSVRCQQERSQMRNKEIAIGMIKARLLEAAQAQRVEDLGKIRGEMIAAEWGTQIRSCEC